MNSLSMHRSIFLLLLSVTPAFAADWPQWRGQRNDGHSPDTDIPLEWGPDKNILWKCLLPGPGISTPCIWRDRIFLTALEGIDGLVFCIGTDGKERWRRKLGTGVFNNRSGEDITIASASPCTDGKLVYVFMGSGEVAAFDFDGNRVWLFNVVENSGPIRSQFGGHWTPVLFKDRLYVCVLHRMVQKILAIDKTNGKLVWSIDRKSDSFPGSESPDVYSSPLIWENGDKSLLIVHGNDYCTAHRLNDGEEVWRVTELNPKANYNRAWRAISSPLVSRDIIVIPSCKNGVTVILDPRKASGSIAPEHPAVKWRLAKGAPDIPSPLLVEGVVYLLQVTGRLDAYDAETGASLFSERLASQRHRACPLFVDGKILLVGRDGSTSVVKAGREFELLATNKLPDTFSASPVAAGGRLYLRGTKVLWAIGTR